MIFFEWDEAKAEANWRKHGVQFEDAIAVFDDPDAIFQKDRVVEGELRWFAIGVASGMTLLFVAHTLRESSEDAEEVIRIISARRTTRKEQKLYGENRTKDISGY
jgi:uncharacterized DUF497 family protein